MVEINKKKTCNKDFELSKEHSGRTLPTTNTSTPMPSVKPPRKETGSADSNNDKKK